MKLNRRSGVNVLYTRIPANAESPINPDPWGRARPVVDDGGQRTRPCGGDRHGDGGRLQRECGEDGQEAQSGHSLAGVVPVNVGRDRIVLAHSWSVARRSNSSAAALAVIVPSRTAASISGVRWRTAGTARKRLSS